MGRFRTFLLGERNASERTVANYEMDIAQFAAFKWDPGAEGPFDWASATPSDARSFLMAFAREEACATTTRRKLASLRPPIPSPDCAVPSCPSRSRRCSPRRR